MSWKNCTKLFLILLMSTLAFADEDMIDFEDPSISVINEELRQIRDDNRDSKRGVGKVVTIADGDVTPSVSGGSIFVTSSNTGATAITTFRNAKKGQIITIIGGSNTNSSTVADGGATFFLTANWTASLNDSLTLYYNGSIFIELSRANN